LEDQVGREEEAGVLRRERVEGDGGPLAHIELEVLQAAWEEDDVALLQGGRVQDVVVADEARVHAALEHEQRLGGARVGVQREHAAHGEVEAHVGDALRVDAGPLVRSRHDVRRAQGRVGNLVKRQGCNNKFTSSVLNNPSVRHLDLSIYTVIACNEISTQCNGFMTSAEEEDYSRGFRRPLNTKSSAVTVLRGLHGNPFTRGALADRSATQKSCKGLGSAAFTALRKAVALSATRSMLMRRAALAEVFAIAAAAEPSSVRITCVPQTSVLDRATSVR
jgi:hypothetical protein